MTDVTAQDIEALVQTFDESSWDEIRVVVDGCEIHLSKDSANRSKIQGAPEPAERNAPPFATPGDKLASATASQEAEAEPAGIPPGQVAVRAPNLGTFYRAPKPGAPPYVSIGQKIDADTEVCLIEVMKLFTPVRAGVAGIVRDILIQDAQLVEFDQPLALIEPTE